jgi:predicted short-subunit dehydrogenase-like oxidoreductase (DUF2520 family)
MTDSSRRVALVGPGRAGTALALALVASGHDIVAVAGRAADAASVQRAAQRFAVPTRAVEVAAPGADLVVVATPDGVIADVAARLAPTLDAGTLVVHLSGALGLDALDAISATRPDVEVGALHPLQTFPSGTLGAAHLDGAWAAVAGPPSVAELATDVGLRPFAVADDRRATYHAAACIASNHLVALLGQVERVAAAAAVPFEAFEPLVRTTIANVFAIGPAAALTGPVARGDLDTVQRHLRALAEDEIPTYRALARAATALTPGDDADLRELLA